MIMSALHSRHLSLRWCTVSAHDSQKRWCPQGTRALRGSLRLFRQTLQQSSNALAAGSDVTANPLAVSDRSFVPHPRLRRRHRSLSKDAHSALRCGRPCDMASDCIGEYAPLFQRAEQVAYLRVQIAHSRIVHPCHTVLISPLLHCPLPQIQRSPIKVYLCRVSWKYVNSIGVFAYFSQQIRLCLSNTLTSNL